MNFKTNLLEDYVNFVVTKKKKNTYLWLYIVIHVFKLIILTIKQVVLHLKELYF